MPQQSRNHIALGLLILAKAVGVGGLVVGAVHRVGGAVLLGADGVLLIVAVAMCIGTMREQAKADLGQKEVLAQMLREGTLKQYLRDLQDEARSQVTVDSEAAAE